MVRYCHLLLFLGALVSVLFTSKLIDLWRFYATESQRQYDARLEPLITEGSSHQYSYSVEDFPERWSNPRPKVLMEMEESVHYGIEPLAYAYEWKKLTPANAPVRVGSNFNVAVLPLIHQLHCVEVFKDTLKASPSLHDDWSHTQHCANYLRQWAMCKADLTLERNDFRHRHFDWDRAGTTHECFDWGSVYEGIAVNWKNWLSFWEKNELEKYLYQAIDFETLQNE